MTAATGSVFGLAVVVVSLAFVSLVLCVITIGLMMAVVQLAVAP